MLHRRMKGPTNICNMFNEIFLHDCFSKTNGLLFILFFLPKSTEELDKIEMTTWSEGEKLLFSVRCSARYELMEKKTPLLQDVTGILNLFPTFSVRMSNLMNQMDLVKLNRYSLYSEISESIELWQKAHPDSQSSFFWGHVQPNTTFSITVRTRERENFRDFRDNIPIFLYGKFILTRVACDRCIYALSTDPGGFTALYFALCRSFPNCRLASSSKR